MAGFRCVHVRMIAGSRAVRRAIIKVGENGAPGGIRTRDLHLERVASWASRRRGLEVDSLGYVAGAANGRV